MSDFDSGHRVRLCRGHSLRRIGSRHERLCVRALVVQIVQTFSNPASPTFVERLDAWALKDSFGLPLPPVMVYGDDLTHIVTEEGIASLLLCDDLHAREQAIRAVAGYTPVGLGRDRAVVARLRAKGAVAYPEDLGVEKRLANRDLLAARSVRG